MGGRFKSEWVAGLGRNTHLASLSEDERRQVWEEATAQAEAEQKKLTAKMVQEAVDRLNAEKAELQSTLALIEQRAEDFRAESIKNGKALKETDQLAKTAQSEAATLRRTLAAEYKVGPATIKRDGSHQRQPDRAKDLGKPGSWSAATAPSSYRKTQVARLVRGKLGGPGEISLRNFAQ